MLYAVLGAEEYHFYKNSGHTCFSTKEVAIPFPLNVTKNTDIHEHLVTLYMLTVEMKLRTIVELGTRTGESTIPLLFAAKKIGGKVSSFDINDCPKAKAMIASYNLQQYWSFTQSDDLKVDWNEPIDHLFIDTSHTYEQTLNELRKLEPWVRNGGVITMHDPITCPEVREATLSYMKNRPDLVIYEYANNNGLYVIFKSNSDGKTTS